MYKNIEEEFNSYCEEYNENDDIKKVYRKIKAYYLKKLNENKIRDSPQVYVNKNRQGYKELEIATGTTSVIIFILLGIIKY